jgi:MoaA/NifB/PqqE/SkfB family radical SAM enzyme
MADQHPTLRCVGCERPATAKARPDPLGYWLCKCCEHDMRWAMAWMDRVWPKGGPVVVLGEKV